ncbi:hypothetical protein PV327_010117 [Microctonus hyperodae]|uniref:Uncharacterized protein n=1 Tax=Microctonus hyperodae TaxID=165561 RepID=A0AA39FRG7_MICHY|nr:hypothetical protein PV327_010117 [Microctonus hyperodae]
MHGLLIFSLAAAFSLHFVPDYIDLADCWLIDLLDLDDDRFVVGLDLLMMILFWTDSWWSMIFFSNTGHSLPRKMSKQTRQYKFLEEINNIGEEFSEIGEDEFSENEDILVANENEFESAVYPAQPNEHQIFFMHQ